jgi:hypothetical protein
MPIGKCNVPYVKASRFFCQNLLCMAFFGWGYTMASHAQGLPQRVIFPGNWQDDNFLTEQQVLQAAQRWKAQTQNPGEKMAGEAPAMQSSAELSDYLNDFLLQSGYSHLQVRTPADAHTLYIDTLTPAGGLKVSHIDVTGGSPQDRYIVSRHLGLAVGAIFDREAFLEKVNWIGQNHFLPLQIRFERTPEQTLELKVHIPLGAAWIPTGNLAQNRITGLSITGGTIVDNPMGSGLVARASVKRNNLEVPFISSTREIQDWEYVLSLSSTQQAIPGMSVGINQYNKVDFIYPGHGNDPDQLLWIRSTGLDFYSGFQLWEDLVEHRYLRGVFNVSLIEDRFFSRLDPEHYPQQQTQSGKNSDTLILPSFTLSYSDIDDYRIPRNGSFLQGRVSTGFGDSRYSQATATGTSFWSPYVDDQGQWTFLFRSALGTTFGQSPPFYRGFLNTGSWLVRGATQFSITEKHSVRFSEEMHYVFRPSAIQMDKWTYAVTQEPGALGYLDDWALDVNVFLDQGAYWRDSLAWQSAQLSVGSGVNLITPGGSILGLDFALPLYPEIDGISVMLRLSAPLNFTLYSDWFNSNGFFLR